VKVRTETMDKESEVGFGNIYKESVGIRKCEKKRGRGKEGVSLEKREEK